MAYDARRMSRVQLSFNTAVAAWVASAALVSTADARPASTGFFAEAGFGATKFLPPDGANAKLGPTVQIRVGRDLLSWVSLGIAVAASSHEATVPAPPVDEWFQLYRGGGDVRLGGLLGKVALFVEGGAGVSMLSSNILEKVMTVDPGERFSITFHGGAGIEYQLENRHYALGAAVDVVLAPQFDNVKLLDTRIYLRYTYGGG
jgi:hypothetical protein